MIRSPKFLTFPKYIFDKLGVSRKFVTKSGDVWLRIARLTDHPQKWACCFWNLLALRIPKSTGSFLWDVCEPSNSWLKSIDFIKNLNIHEIANLKIGKKINWFWSRIAQLTDYPQKWDNTLWKGLAFTIPKSTGSFLWDVCEPSNSRSKSIDFFKDFQILYFHGYWNFW